MSRVIVIGGGASGLVASIYAAKSGHQVTLLEKNKNCGKKILITGNGKCNYWNQFQNLNHYHTTSKEKLKDIINKENQQEILNFFEKIGIVPKIKDGYYYPYSNQAISIQTALMKEAEHNQINIQTETEVISIQKQAKKFNIKTNHGTYQSEQIILSTGSLACPKTGSTGFGYQLAKIFGHTIIQPLPALVQLESKLPFLKEWHGIRLDGKVTLIEDNKIQNSQLGEIQLTNYGLSGICIFNLSSQISRGLSNHKKEQISINFLYFLQIHNPNHFITWMTKRNKTVKNRTIADLLDGILNYKLVNLLLKICKIPQTTTWEQLSEKKKYLLGMNLTNFIVDITGTKSFEYAQTTTGGIPLTEIHSKTMESKKEKGLYITGELLDVDGECGGYNLSFAWITGMIAGRSIK